MIPRVTADVLARAQAGDREAFDVLFDTFQLAILNYIWLLMGRYKDAAELAEDLTQDVFLKAYLALPAAVFPEPGAVRGWLYRIATNAVRDEVRHRRVLTWVPFRGIEALANAIAERVRYVGGGFVQERRSAGYRVNDAPAVFEAVTDHDTDANPEAAVLAAEGAALARRLLAGLRPEWREVLTLREYGDLDYDQIAAATGTTRSSVKSRLWRAREQLRAAGAREEAAP